MNEEEKAQREIALEKPSLFGMFLEPKKQFERLKDNPIILVPFIIIAVLTTIGMFVMMSQIDFIAQDPELANMREHELMFVTIFTQFIFVITCILAAAASILVSSFVYFSVAKIVQSEVTSKQLFSINRFIYIISVLRLFMKALSFFSVATPDPE